MAGSKKQISDLGPLGIEEEAGSEEGAVIISKTSKKRKNKAENGDLEVEKKPKEKKKKKKEKKKHEENIEIENERVLNKAPASSTPDNDKCDEDGETNPDMLNIDYSNIPLRERAALDRATAQPELHMDVFRNLSSVDASVREAASRTLVKELQEVQRAYERCGMKDRDGGDLQLEAAKDDCLKDCAPTLRYALRRLIRGVSSSRACARQGFALGLATLVSTIHCIELEALMKLIDELLEVTSSMKGQDARDGLLGRLFAYGALVRSGLLAAKTVAVPDKNARLAKEITQNLLILADKKTFMRESAVTIILDLVDRVPTTMLLTGILEAPLLKDWLRKDPDSGNPDSLLLALKLHDKLPLELGNMCKFLPQSCSLNDLFTPEHMLFLVPCLKKTSFCHPRVHSVWSVLVDILFADMATASGDTTSCHTSKKTKKSRKRNNPEKNLARRLISFWEVVVEGSLLSSSHDQKHLAIDILLMLLPRTPASCVQIILSYKFIRCLLDILSAKDSLLHKSAQNCLQEILNWAVDDEERRIAVVIALQKNSDGKFDNVSRTQTVRKLVGKFDTKGGCFLFVQKLTGIFLDGSSVQLDEDSRSDKLVTGKRDAVPSMRVDGLEEDDENLSVTANDPDDLLRSWVVDCLYHLSRNAALDATAKFCLQKEILKFLAVQGLFTASLGIEVTSFELQEKLKWPKRPASSHVRRLCIEQMQHLLSDAQHSLIAHKHAEINEGIKHEVSPFESNDLGAYVMCFLETLRNIPSVSLFWPLSKDDEDTFKKLHNAEAQLFQTAHKSGSDFSKMQAMRFLLIQLLLQILLRPGEVCEMATELVICCKKAFGSVLELEVEDQDDEGEPPVLMDVLVDTLLSLLPQSPAPVRGSVEQVFRCFCDSLTESGLLNMLRIIKKDLKPARRKSTVVGDSDEEDLVDIEESDDNLEEQEGKFETGEEDNNTDDNCEEQTGKFGTVPNLQEDIGKETGDSEDSGSDFDDETMFRMDSYLTRIFKEKKIAAGSDNAQTQLVHFKLRVLSLLEFFLQRNPSNPLVLTVYSYLLQAFVNASSIEGNEQLADRIGVILQRKVCKAKEYPKDPELDLSLLEGLLEKVLRLASRSRARKVESLAQACTFWIMKVIHGNFDEIKLKKVSEFVLKSLEDFFTKKKCRLKAGFMKEIFRRHQWLGIASFGLLLDKCRNARSEFLKYEALSLTDILVRPRVIKSTQISYNVDNHHHLQFLKVHLASLSALVQHLLENPAKKPSHRFEARQFCLKVLKALSLLKLEKSLAEILKPDAYAACESHLGDLFRPFRNSI